VFATKYDGDCYGCSGRTYSGTSVAQGVCATDPKVIALGTNFYVEDVPGYGACRAEDIGGAIKGNRIDLGYENAENHLWGAGYTDVYLLTNAPE
jgi:3D (Asp-Asp-Asp) domain-containing protein